MKLNKILNNIDYELVKGNIDIDITDIIYDSRKIIKDSIFVALVGYNVDGHKARNYLIQGSAADFLKIKFKEIDEFLIKGGYKTRLVMTVHDENIFEIYDGEEFLIPKLQQIMQQLEGSQIPILADLEVTTTTWDEKEDLVL